MAKIYFRYGSMNSSKTAQLLMVAHNYKEQGKKVILFTPSIDNRYGVGKITSRTGLQENAIVLDKTNNENIFRMACDLPDCILVDEVQMLEKHHIEQFRKVADILNIPIICYGLKNNFKGELFSESIQYLLAIADSIEEIKTTCVFCNKKATQILKIKEGKPVRTGETIEVGGNDLYYAVCREHWFKPPMNRLK